MMALFDQTADVANGYFCTTFDLIGGGAFSIQFSLFTMMPKRIILLCDDNKYHS